MLIADLHCDSLTKVSAERGLLNEYNTSCADCRLQLFAAFVPHRGRSAEERRRELMRYANVYFYETDRLSLARITNSRELCELTDLGGMGAIFSVEGGGGLLSESDELFTLSRAGLRVLGPIWDTNELGCSCYDKDDTGLTDEGKRLVRRCSELGITIDLSHMSDRAFYDSFDISPMPHIATHSNFRDVCNHPRNLTLDMARAIVGRGGVIGLNIYPEHLKSGGDATLDDLLRHIDYGLERLGEGALALGLDIDGTDGKYPAPLNESESIHDRVVNELLRRYPDATVRRIAGECATDFFLENL